MGAFIFDKVHLQVSHRDAFSCTHPASAGAGARSLSTLRTHVIATCADLAEGVKKAARTIVLLQMTQILKSVSNPLSASHAPRKSIVMGVEGVGGFTCLIDCTASHGLPRRWRWSARRRGRR